MEMKRVVFHALATLPVVSCAVAAINANDIGDVYVTDFRSDDIERCQPSDVDLTHSEARDFFIRAKRVDARTLHDHYNYGSCLTEGILKYRSESCDWEIRAGATGQIKCGSQIWYFACDECDDLFETKATQ